MQGNREQFEPKVPGHQSSISREAAEFWRAESGGDSLSAAEFVLQLQYVSVHVPLRAQFFYSPPPPLAFLKHHVYASGQEALISGSHVCWRSLKGYKMEHA